MVRLSVLAVLMLVAGCAATLAPPPTPSTTSPSPSPPPPVETPMDAYLRQLASQWQFRGSVLLAVNGRIEVRAGYGPGDTASTRYEVGSLTKAFTGLAVVTLAHAGALELTDSLCRYVPSCPADWQPITVTDLLDHTSGLPDYATDASVAGYLAAHHDPEDALTAIAGQPLGFAPGTSWRYSNTDYNALAVVIEHVTGRPYTDYVTKQILAPLGMTSTDLNPTPGGATPYTNWTTPGRTTTVDGGYGAIGVESDVDDLYRWAQAMLTPTPPVTDSAILSELFAPGAPIAGTPNGPTYHDGWYIEPEQAEYHHDGGIEGYQAGIALLPSQHAVLIVLSNLATTDMPTVAKHIAALAGLSLPVAP
jgi:CubicO group peptidase (beta-lactamase class C family)